MEQKKLEEALALLKENEHHPFTYEIRADGGIHYYYSRTPLTDDEIIEHIEEQIEDFNNWIQAADAFLKASVPKSGSEVPLNRDKAKETSSCDEFRTPEGSAAVKEGWAFISDDIKISGKRHYVDDFKVLCGLWFLYEMPKDIKQGDDDRYDNCGTCRKILAKRRGK